MSEDVLSTGRNM